MNPDIPNASSEDSDIECLSNDSRDFANAGRQIALAQILHEPFAGKVSLFGIRRDEATERANGEYDVLDLTNKLVFWTDASIRKGRVGIAIVWKDNHYDVEWKNKTYVVRGASDIGAAEFFAIAEALKIADRIVRDRHHREDDRVSKIVVYSDSVHALKLIQDFHVYETERQRSFSHHLELARLKERTKKLAIDFRVPVELQWVKGHNGVEGNEIADDLASQTTSRKSKAILQMRPNKALRLSKRRARRISRLEERTTTLDSTSTPLPPPIFRLPTLRLPRSVQQTANAMTSLDPMSGSTLAKPVDSESSGHPPQNTATQTQFGSVFTQSLPVFGQSSSFPSSMKLVPTSPQRYNERIASPFAKQYPSSSIVQH